MSDLTATQCGCNRADSGNGCNSIIWIILLLCLCNGNGNDCGSNGILGGCGSDNGCECIIIILLLLSCCGGNSIF